MKEASSSSGRLGGLDSIRFFCALWVFFYHDPPPGQIDGHSALALAARGLAGNIWCGPAAVIVFFIISGFCIHYPYVGAARRLNLREFYARRFLRLVPPMLAAIVLGKFSGVSLGFMQVSVLWSLLAEFIYYLLYPLLRSLRLRLGSWLGLVLVAYVAAFLVVRTNPLAPDYPSFGPALNWVVGLPCWLLGCGLAESVSARPGVQVSAKIIWPWRLAILALGIGCSFLRFHAAIGYPWTLDLFALPATFWLQREIVYHRLVPANGFLEWAGLRSYSLYLVHGPAAAIFRILFAGMVSNLLVQWLVMVLFVLGFASLFYYFVERTSHILAQKAGRRLRSAPGLAAEAAQS